MRTTSDASVAKFQDQVLMQHLDNSLLKSPVLFASTWLMSSPSFAKSWIVAISGVSVNSMVCIVRRVTKLKIFNH